MALINLHEISLAYGGLPLLDRADLLIGKGERVCLLGRNGTGKSTLLRLIHGEIAPDEGQIDRTPGSRTALLSQEVPSAAAGTVGDLLEQLDDLPLHEEPWELRRRTDAVLEGLGLHHDEPFGAMSGGLKRRVFLGLALIARPDLLLLDEPTNHLDIRAITWLEQYLERFGGTLLFVSHDRMFIDHLATRIVELDRGVLTSYPGSHAAYVARKADELAVEQAHRAEFDRKLALEETWIRQGIRARRTRNEGRVRALIKLREERQARRDQVGSVRLRIQESERSGKLVLVASDLTFGYGDGPPVVRGLDTTVLRGDRVGLIGPNGCGKTTLLKLLLGQLQPRGGTVRHGTRLDIVYLDQLRAQLRDDRTVADNVADGADTVSVGGTARSIYAYLQDFLFSPDKARSPASVLSGGERNRLLLARLFARTSNVVVLDEPTNDLDTDTLDLLEERLLEYKGTLLLVSHDRAFLDNVVTSTLAFEGGGLVQEYVGGYSDWVRQRQQQPSSGAESGAAAEPSSARKGKPRALRARKLTYAEGLELGQLPARIEGLEADRDALQEQMAAPEFYRRDRSEITAELARLEQLERQLEQVYERWQQLEELASRS